MCFNSFSMHVLDENSKRFISQDSIFYTCICPQTDILYLCRTKIHMVKNMTDLFMSNLWIIAPTLWACLIVYVVWYSTKAKSCAPITSTEAKQLWAIHLQNTRCSSRKWRQLKHHGQTIGFECGCGYKHVQHRPLVASTPTTSEPLPTPNFNTLQPSKTSS
jgi:hypothetical protein